MKFRIFTAFLLLILMFTFSTSFLFSQPIDSLRSNAIKVFIDCGGCDLDYTRKEVTFVNYVREVREADVYVLITSMATGGGGEDLSIMFNGQGRFNGMKDTLHYIAAPDETDDEMRTGATKIFKAGLVRYVAHTPLINEVSIIYEAGDDEKIVEDKWKSWVFTIDFNGFTNAEQSYLNFSTWSSVSIEKITPKWKTEFDASNSYNESRFDLGDEIIVGLNRSYYFSNTTVFSLSDHWSAGGFAQSSHSTYNNTSLSFSIYPAIEYNIFKYQAATQRQLTFRYYIGPAFYQYIDTTIYDKLDEIVLRNKLAVGFKSMQKWGSVEGSLSGMALFDDFNKNNVNLWTSLSIRILRGLSFNVSGSVSLVHDQIALSKAGASSEEILLQQRQLETQYSFWTSFGISYTFGSLYNNVVNPRFEL
ncbi:MAG: hypothetical protein KKA07_04350 [Bacteroidetes bacterium]|nr:hypothetical protein [Bacteroidota bacterium]MBU1718283.1 hypothetical protein [Bacteroidota bacterium]